MVYNYASKGTSKSYPKAGIKPEQVDFYEINEAFSVVAIANNQLMKLDPNKVNVHGGAVSLGHPLGASGARIIVTLIHVLKQHGGKIELPEFAMAVAVQVPWLYN